MSELFSNKKHLTVNDETTGLGGVILLGIGGEMLLVKDKVSYTLSSYEYTKYIKSNKIMPRFRLFVLNPDETIKEDISDYIVHGSGSLNINYQQGQRRSLNLSLINSDGRWTPNARTGEFWLNTLFRFDLGINYQGDDFWYPQGIYVSGNPKANGGSSNKTVDIQLVDKFAKITGKRGNIINTHKISVKTDLFVALRSLLWLNTTNGELLDFKPLIFDDTLRGLLTPYTINKSPNQSIGDIILDLSNFASSNCYYDTLGHMVIQSGLDDLELNTKPIIWSFNTNEMEYSEPSLNFDFDNVVNIVRVVGANINGSLVDYTVINNNPYSPTNISYGDRSELIEDQYINTEVSCRDRARWELNKKTILSVQADIKTSFIPTLDVNNIIEITDSQYGFNREKFVIQSLNIPISTTGIISMSCTNIKDLPYYI